MFRGPPRKNQNKIQQKKFLCLFTRHFDFHFWCCMKGLTGFKYSFVDIFPTSDIRRTALFSSLQSLDNAIFKTSLWHHLPTSIGHHNSHFSQIKIYNWNLGLDWQKKTLFEMTLEHLLKLEQNRMKCIKLLLLPVFTKQEPENEDIGALKCLKIKCQHRSRCLNCNTS